MKYLYLLDIYLLITAADESKKHGHIVYCHQREWVYVISAVRDSDPDEDWSLICYSIV